MMLIWSNSENNHDYYYFLDIGTNTWYWSYFKSTNDNIKFNKLMNQDIMEIARYVNRHINECRDISFYV